MRAELEALLAHLTETQLALYRLGFLIARDLELETPPALLLLCPHGLRYALAA